MSRATKAKANKEVRKAKAQARSANASALGARVIAALAHSGQVDKLLVSQLHCSIVGSQRAQPKVVAAMHSEIC